MYDVVLLTEHNKVWRIPPFGAYLIAHILRSNGYKVLVIDMYTLLGDNLNSILEKSISKQTKFVGYSSTLFSTSFDIKTYTYPWLPTDVDFLIKTNAFIKQCNSNCKIIFGGSHSKTLVKEAGVHNTNFGVDYAMHGYSEVMIIDFIKSLSAGKQPKFSRKTNNIYEIDYDSLGTLVDFKNSTMRWYKEDYILQGEALPMEIARGCIFKCKYCSYPLLGKDPRDSSYIKDENQILREILENYENFSTTTYSVVDDTFNENDEKLKLLLRVRDKSKLDLNFIGYLRLDLIHRRPDQLQMLVDAKFNGLFFGIESMHYPTLKYIGKGIKPEHIKETLYKIKDKFNGTASIVGNFIIGLPHETEETFHDWVDWVMSQDCPLTWRNFNPLYITQHGNTTHNDSEFYKNYGKYGYEIYNKHEWKNASWNFKRVGQLALKYNMLALNSAYQKIPALHAVGLKKFGYSYYDLINMPEKSMFNDNYNFLNTSNSNDLNSLFAKHFEDYKNSYIKHLSDKLNHD